MTRFLFIAGVLVLLGLGIAALAFIVEAWARARDPGNHPPPGVLIDLDGVRRHVHCIGAGGPTVVIVAGGGTASVADFPLQARIAEFARVCVVDRPGIGWSDPSPAASSFDEHAHDLRRVLALAGEQAPFILVGASFGGLVARAFARQAPDDVVGMVLVDSAEEAHIFPRYARMQAGLSQLKLYDLLGRFGVLRWLAAHRPEMVGVPKSFPSAERQRLGALISRPGYFRAARQEAETYPKTPDADRKAGGFGTLGDLPLVVIQHGHPFTGSSAWVEEGWAQGQARLAALSTKGQIVTAHGSGHMIGLEAPDLVAQAVRGVLSSIRR